MRGERIIAALRRPLNKRVRFRRSTVIMVSLFVVLAGLLAYHDDTKSTPTSAACTSSHCRTVNHRGPPASGRAATGTTPASQAISRTIASAG